MNPTLIALLVGVLGSVCSTTFLVFLARRSNKREREAAPSEFLTIRLQCSKCGHRAAFVTHDADKEATR